MVFFLTCGWGIPPIFWDLVREIFSNSNFSLFDCLVYGFLFCFQLKKMYWNFFLKMHIFMIYLLSTKRFEFLIVAWASLLSSERHSSFFSFLFSLSLFRVIALESHLVARSVRPRSLQNSKWRSGFLRLGFMVW